MAGERRLGLAFAGAPSVPEMARLARLAEEHGYDSVWMAETRITRDAFVPLAAMAAATERILLGTAIVNVYTRNVTVLAISFNSLRELAPGRIVAGLGAGSPAILAQQGISFARPLTRVREATDVLRRLLRGEAVERDGETMSLAGARLEDMLSSGGDALAGGEIPVYHGATGPRAVELAGEVADGVIFNICLPTAYVVRSLDRIAAGAARAGRPAADVDVTMALVVSMDDDGRRARDRVRPFVGLYLSVFPNIARETGLPDALVARVRTAFERDGVDAAARLVGDDVLAELVVAGTPAECQARIDAYRAAGVGTPLLIPVDGTWDATVQTLR